MSFALLKFQVIINTGRTGLQRVIALKNISQGSVRFTNEAQEEIEAEPSDESNQEPKVDPRSDRSKPIPVETSIKYLQSDAYNETYGNDPIWFRYRRNFKGQFAPPRTRKTCVRNEALATSNPCPICRDEYLVLDYRNTSLLYQFISKYNGEIFKPKKTGLCRRQHENLLVALCKAKDYGTIKFDPPFMEYKYSDWYKPESETKKEQETEKENKTLTENE